MKNKIIQIFSLFFLFFLLSWNGIAQDTWYVNDNSTTGDVYTTDVGDDANAGTAAAPFLTIAKAVNSATAGDIIKVDAGSYDVNALVISKTLTFEGVNAGIHPAIGTHPSATVGTRNAESQFIRNGITFRLDAENIKFDGFEFIGTGGRIIDVLNTQSAKGFHLTNSIITDATSASGVGKIQFASTGNNDNLLFDYNLFNDGTNHTIYLGGNGSYNNVTLQYNQFKSKTNSLFWANSTALTGGIIDHNEFDGAAGTKNNNINIGQAGNLHISSNWFHGINYTAIQCGIINGSVSNNKFENYKGATGSAHIQLWGGEWGTSVSQNVNISNNEFHYNNDAANPVSAVRLRGTGAIDGTTIHVNNNTFLSGGARSDAYAVLHQGDPTKAVDASCNWWGQASGPASGQNSGNVTAGTYLTSGTDASPGTLGFQPTGACIGPVHNTTQGTYFSTIQAAINDAQTVDGDNIVVAAGTYTETVNVNKEVTITGAGKGNDPLTNTIINALTSCTGTGFNVTASNVTLQNMRVTDFQMAVTLSNVANPSLTNLALTDYCLYGVRLDGSNSTIAISNTDIQTTSSTSTVGIRAGTASAVNGMTIDGTTITSNRQGIAVYQATTPVAFDNIVIKNSTISNNTQKGIYLEKLSNASFENLTMDNNGTDAGYGNNNGIDINLKYGSYSNIIIKDCDITNSGVTGTASDPQNPAALTIKARDDGPSYSSNPATLSNVTIKNNRITGPQNGIRIGEYGKTNTTPTNVIIEGNDLSYAFTNKAIISRIDADIAVNCNWHGATDFPTVLTDLSENGSGHLVLSTVLNNGTDGNGAVGFQPTGTCIGPVHNITQNTYYGTIQAGVDAANANDIIEVAAGTYTEAVTVNKAVTLKGANVGIAGTGVRGTESILEDGSMNITASGAVTIDGFKIHQTNNTTDVFLISGATAATIQNNIFERDGVTAGQFVRAITTSDGSGAKVIQNNWFTGDISGGLYSGHKTWNNAIYVNAATSTVTINNNKIENVRSGINLDDYQTGISVHDNIFVNNGTHIAFGGTTPTTGQYTFGANEFGVGVGTIINLSNVNTNFRLDLTSSTFNGSLASAWTIPNIFGIEASMYHKGRSGKNGLVTYVAGNQYVDRINGDKTTLQAANDYAVAGMIVNLQDGTYNERVIIDKSLTLQGQSEAGVILDGTGLSGTGSGIKINSNVTGVTIQKMTIQNYTGSSPNGDAGIYVGVANDGFKADQVTVKNNVSAAGIFGIGPVDGFEVTNSTVSGHGPGARGIVIWNGFKKNINISNNTVTNNNCCGIELQDGSASGVTISGNIVYGNKDNGIGLVGLTSGAGPNVISNNLVQDNGRFGIEIKNPMGTGLATGDGSIVVENNTVELSIMYATNFTLTEARDLAGIAVFRRSPIFTDGNPNMPQGVIVRNNTVQGYKQPSSSDGFGIVAEGQGHIFTNNTLNRNDVGLQFQMGHTPYSGLGGVPDAGDQSNIADQYFGRGNAPQSCGLVDNVQTYGTAGVNANTTNFRTVGFGTNFAQLNGRKVENTSTGIEYCSIQQAIDDNPTLTGHTIQVGAGTYAENVVVGKSVSILGPNATIDPCTGTRGAEAIVVPSTSAISSGEIFHVAASNVTISGFTIDGDNTALTSGFSSTNGADIDAAEGIAVYEDNISNLTVQNNIIQNLAYTGITLFGSSYSAPETHGHVISNNKIQDLGTYDVSSSIDKWGLGILLYNSQYTHVHDNCLSNVRVGIQTGNFQKANTGTSTYQLIEDNTIQARSVGIFYNLQNFSPLTIKNNTITALYNVDELGASVRAWNGILAASLGNNMGQSTLQNNNVDAVGLTPAWTRGSDGINVWNVKHDAPVNISGGTIQNVDRGVFLNNFEGYNSDGGDGAHATVSGVSIAASNIGLYLHDHPSSTHGAVKGNFTNNTITAPIGIQTEETTAGTTAGVFSNNTVNADAKGILITGMSLSGSNALDINNNTVTMSTQLSGGAPSIGIQLSNLVGTAAATVLNNTVSGAHYGYSAYNVNTTPVTSITNGSISGVMQGIAVLNTDGVTKKESKLDVSNVSMNGFTGTSSNPAINFHAGIYTYTSGGTGASEGITMNVDGVTIDGTHKPDQSSGGINISDYSGGTVNVQNITVSNSNILNNDNRGVDARGMVTLNLNGNTLTNNGHDAWGSGGNYGFSVLARNNAVINANNNFITLPATSTSEVYGLFTGNLTGNSIVAHDNSILLNGNTNVNSRLAKSAAGTGSMDATCNWWGTLVVNDLASLIEGNVTYTPSWLTSGTDNVPGTPGFQPAPGTCLGVPMAISVGTITNALCTTGTNGSIDITTSGGTAPYTYLWSDGQTVEDAINLAAGSYNVTATDIYGNTATVTGIVVGTSPVVNTTTLTGYTTIQGAINVASTGDVINVCAGTYNEQVVVNKELTINGAKAGVDPRPSNATTRVIDDASESIITGTKGQTLIKISAKNVTINGFEIKQTGSSGGAHAINTTSNYTNISLLNNIIYNTGTGNAMRLYGGDNFLIQQNYLKDISGEGIVLRNGNNQITPATNQKIKDNEIVNVNGVAGGAVVVYGEKDLEISGNIINAKYQGISIGATGPAYYDMNNINVHHNTIYSELLNAGGVTKFAVLINGLGTGVNIHNNIIGQSGSATTTYPLIRVGYDGDLASVSNPSGLLINDNSLSMVSGSTGKYMYIGNNITNNIDGKCNWWTVTDGNSIDAMINRPSIVDHSTWLTSGGNSATVGFTPTGTCDGTPVVLTAVAHPKVCSGDGSIDVSWTGGTANYTVAWSGTASGSTSGLTASPYTISNLTNGTYDVTITDANGTIIDTVGVVIEYHPVTNTSTSETFATIQGAIDATNTVNGNTIVVCAGTYNENLVVNKELDIRGPNYGINPNTGTLGSHAFITFPTASDGGELMVIRADNVKVDGFTFDGSNNVTATGSSGILGYGNNIEVTNNIVSNFNYVSVWFSSFHPDYPTPSQRTFYRDNALVSNNFINNSSIFNSLNGSIVGYGIYMQGAYGSVTNNVVEDTKDAIQVQPYQHPNSSNVVGLVSGNNFEGYREPIWYNAGGGGISTPATNWSIVNNNLTGIAPPTGVTIPEWKGFRVHSYKQGILAFNSNNINQGSASASTYRLITNTEGSPTQQLNADCNWYGTAVGNTIAAGIDGSVDYVSWLSSGGSGTTIGFTPTGTCDGTPVVLATTVNNASCEGNDGFIKMTWTGGTANFNVSLDGATPITATSPYTFNSLAAGNHNVKVVDANGTYAEQLNITVGTNPVKNTNTGLTYATIQDAIDASETDNGNEIVLCDGPFDEQVLVNKELSIKPATVSGSPATPVVNFTGTPSGKPTLFDVSKNNVSIDGIHFNVDLSKLKSAIIASAADIDLITIKNNTFTPYGTASSGTYMDRNAVSVNFGGSNNYRVATGGVDNIVFDNNTVVSNGTNSFRAGISADEAGGTFTNNTIQSISQDVQVRFASQAVTITDNAINGGGVEYTSPNAGSANISNNTFDGTWWIGLNPSNPIANPMLRLKQNTPGVTTTVKNNTFTNHRWGISLENYNNDEIANNSFTPLSTASEYRHITVNTKLLNSPPLSSIGRVTISADIHNNIFNGNSVVGSNSKALAFYNHWNDAPAASYGNFNVTGNTFNTGIKNYIYLDDLNSVTNDPYMLTNYPEYADNNAAVSTTACWGKDIIDDNNLFAVGGSGTPKLYSSMTNLEIYGDLFAHIFDKVDNSCAAEVKFGQVPDLEISSRISNSNLVISNSDLVNYIMEVSEASGNITTNTPSSPVYVRIQKDNNNLIYSFDPNLTTMLAPSPRTINNPDWDLVIDNSSQMVFKLKPGVQISGYSLSSIGITIQVKGTASNSQIVLSPVILNNSGGETNNINNINSRIINLQ
ncbi:MAG TPA: right-handed parallel beta-helix repeat-containing protein [Edaphocola sp.]|nr:right-handed parallel beta-helix repeat-containing protein [Edaphocola sp.]